MKERKKQERIKHDKTEIEGKGERNKKMEFLF